MILVYLPLFWITFHQLSGSLLIPFKSNAAGFKPRKFSLDIFTWYSLENFLLFKAFCREQKRWKSFHARSGEHGRWGLNIPVKIQYFFMCDCCWMRPSVIKGKHNFIPIDECEAFSLKFFIHVAVVESTGLYWVSDSGLKT